MKKVIAILAAILVLTIPLAVSDSATMSVNVGGADPTVDNIVIDSQDTGATVSPNAGTTETVDLEVEASDNNGHGDITSVICTITGAGTVQDSPVTLTAGTIVNPTTREYTGSFDMDFYDASGTYTVDCEATDASAGTGDRQENFTYQPETALDLDADSISFGSMSPGDTDTKTGDTDMGTTTLPTIQNTGNVVIDAQYSASGNLSDGGSNSIEIDNAEIQFASLGWNALSTSSQTELGLDLPVGSSSTTKVDFKLFVPTGTVEASYSTTITISAI